MTAGIWAVAVVIIVAIIAFTEVQKAKHRAKNGIAVDWMGGEKPIAPPTNPALERIATEDTETKRLSAEIESLREK